jgi:hypothetical protein
LTREAPTELAQREFTQETAAQRPRSQMHTDVWVGCERLNNTVGSQVDGVPEPIRQMPGKMIIGSIHPAGAREVARDDEPIVDHLRLHS